MKNIMIISCLFGYMLFNISAQAGTCIKGEELEVDGHTYCYSKMVLNWFAAASWCQSQGRRLAKLEEVCSANDCNQAFRALPTWAWLATPQRKGSMYLLQKDNNKIVFATKGPTESWRALCY